LAQGPQRVRARLEVAPAITAGSTRVCWSTVIGLGAIHVAALVGVVRVVADPVAPTLLLAAVMYVLCGLSITGGYHRLFAHRSYRATRPVRWLFLLFGAGALQNSAVSWGADHRAHHAEADGPADPHAVARGAWFAHVGWLFHRRASSADVTQLRDLWSLRSVRVQHRYYPAVAAGMGLGVPVAVAAVWGDPWGGLLVAGFLRIAVMLHATFCVNSVAHLVGRRRYDADVTARDSVFTALVTFGEGYHSFHHRFPFDYRNGIRWWQYDPSKWLIWLLARGRLVSRLRTASSTTVARAVQQAT
jgi:stearoyl-CoA desaturase (delta-9 desaturase)